eukprot:2582748-Prymnesium_polylepis.1
MKYAGAPRGRPQKEHYANPQQRLAFKNRQKKVLSHNIYKEYKKVLSQEVSGRASAHAAAGSTQQTAAGRAAIDAEQSGDQTRPPRADSKKQGKHAAIDAARRNFERAQAEREVERQAAVEQERQKAAARKRRKEESTKLNRKTRRGQPVLSHQLNKMLSALS